MSSVRVRVVVPVLLAVAAGLVACSAGPSVRDPAGGSSGTGAGVVAGTMSVAGMQSVTPVCPPTNPFCSSPMTTGTGMGTAGMPPAQQSCGDVPIELKPAGVNIMIAVQGAA